MKLIPKLYLRKANLLAEISVEQCSPLMETYRGDYGVNELLKCSIDLYDEEGVEIGEISYNGRIWLNTTNGKIEVPQKGRPTAKDLFGA